MYMIRGSSRASRPDITWHHTIVYYNIAQYDMP